MRFAWRLLLTVALPIWGLQAQASIGDMRRQATRAELELAAKAAESAAVTAPDEKTRTKLRADAAALRQRLTSGDFVPGDRILLLVAGDSALSDTFTVRSERRLTLPDIPDISLHGVLDSELEPFLRRELARYIRDVAVSATPLVRLSVMGAVGQPGYYTVPVDQAITDVIMAAGGPLGNNSEIGKSVIRRGSAVFMNSKSLALAIQQGKTVGDISVRDGDELYVPDKLTASFNWQNAMGVIGAVTGLYFAIRWGFGGGRRIP